MSASEQNLADTLEFFERTISGQIHLTAIAPEKSRPTIGQDFGTDVNAAVKWAAEQNAAGMNVYFAVNRIRDGLHDRAKKEDVTAVRFAHVDIDPPKGHASFTEEEKEAAYARLLAAKPSTINWSGNGWQGLWRLGEGVGEDEVEQINKGLIEKLGGDKGTHDASRLLRVPGLVNYPDAKKRKLGRVPRLSGITVEDDGVVHDHRQMLADFPPPAQALKTQDRQSCDLLDLSDQPLLTADDIRLPEDALLRRLINEPEGADRSADTFRLACQALREGLTPDQVLGLLLNPANAISAHCFDQKDPQRAAKRAIESALSEPDVRAFARAHAQERERRLASGEADEALSAETKLWTLDRDAHASAPDFRRSEDLGPWRRRVRSRSAPSNGSPSQAFHSRLLPALQERELSQPARPANHRSGGRHSLQACYAIAGDASHFASRPLCGPRMPLQPP